ncbi:DUF4179 domain-containing protein [Cytobacillus firmus]|uniref:DUF4179 domain-containing protein n=1 Tax=Cytobacillus firmus TaxID=1399 RepID=UPI0018CF754C|nr:DUF4179 domain-containing protein [Cytobacillus firmus]MBG9654910.1 hypothetical protein [Cytobacillus firmus]MED1907136.1 DUF4179 domain-containing protein [Cytobacillus firmus]
MNRKKSLKQAFINKYGEDLKFSDEDMQLVLNKVHNKKVEQPKRKSSMSPVLMLILTPLIMMILILSSEHLLMTDSKDASKEAEPATESDRRLFGDAGIQTIIKKDLFTGINQTVEKNGVAFTIHEIMYDGTRLALVYSMDKEESNQKGSTHPEFPFFKLSIDGKPFIDYSEGSSYADEKNKFLQEFHTYTDIPDQIQLRIDILRLGEIEGPWSFEFSLEKIKEKYYASPGKSIEKGDTSLTLNELSFSASSTNLNIDMTEPIEKQRIRAGTYIFEIRDNKGNSIAHMTSGATGGGDRDGKFVENFNEYFEPVDKLPKSITIIPYLEKRGEMDYITMPLNQELPIYLEQDQFGGIEIKEVEQKQGEIWIYYEGKGVSESFRSWVDLKEKGSNTPIERINNYEKTAEGYISKFKTSLPLESLIVSTAKRNITKLEGLELEVEIDI